MMTPEQVKAIEREMFEVGYCKGKLDDVIAHMADITYGLPTMNPQLKEIRDYISKNFADYQTGGATIAETVIYIFEQFKSSIQILSEEAKEGF